MNKRFVCQHCQNSYPDFDVAHVCSRGPYAPRLKEKMNNLIEELALQSANEIADLFSPGFFDDRMLSDVAEINKKFAELIVQECARLCDINDKEQGDILREHFGVEE
jgi:hypothetical protein